MREQEDGAASAKKCDLQVILKATGMKIPLIPGNKQNEQGIICVQMKGIGHFWVIFGFLFGGGAVGLH